MRDHAKASLYMAISVETQPVGARVRVDGVLGAKDGAMEPAGTYLRRAPAAHARAKPRS